MLCVPLATEGFSPELSSFLLQLSGIRAAEVCEKGSHYQENIWLLFCVGRRGLHTGPLHYEFCFLMYRVFQGQ